MATSPVFSNKHDQREFMVNLNTWLEAFVLGCPGIESILKLGGSVSSSDHTTRLLCLQCIQRRQARLELLEQK